MLEVKKIDAKLDTAELVCTKTDGTKYNINIFALPLKFVENIYNYEITLDEAKNHKVKSKNLITALNDYKASKENKKKRREKKVLESATELFRGREDIIVFFLKKGVFLFKSNIFKTKKELKEESKDESKEELKEERINKFFKYIEEKSKDINNDLFENYFDASVPNALANKLFETKDKKENNKLVKEIKNRWSNLKDEIEKMSEEDQKLNNKIKY